MSPLAIGAIIFACALVLLLSGIPIWLGLTTVALVALLIMAPQNLTIVPFVIYSSLNEFALLAIPLFIFMAAPLAVSRASFDLYEVIHRWLHWLPGGIGISNIVACAIFAALCGSSPATAAAIGGMGIPQMRERGYPPGFACGLIAVGGTMGILIPPSITMILYGVATETSIGKCFMAGVFPGILLATLSSVWAGFYFYFFVIKRQRKAFQQAQSDAAGAEVAIPYVLRPEKYTWMDRIRYLPKVLPFVAIIFGVMGSLYLGWACPSEAAGIGAFLAFFLTMAIYRAYHREELKRIFSTAISEGSMILMIMAAALFFGYVLSHAYATQAMAEAVVALPLGRWGIMIVIQLFLLILGMFMPPAAIILMVSPILLQILLPLGFDPVWFAAVMTLNMEIGLVSPPVALNLYIVKNIAPDVSMTEVLKGSFPFILCIALTIFMLCLFPQIALWLPGKMIG